MPKNIGAESTTPCQASVRSRTYDNSHGGAPNFVRTRQGVTAKKLYGIGNFTDMIADETVCEEDTAAMFGSGLF